VHPNVCLHPKSWIIPGTKQRTWIEFCGSTIFVYFGKLRSFQIIAYWGVTFEICCDNWFTKRTSQDGRWADEKTERKYLDMKKFIQDYNGRRGR